MRLSELAKVSGVSIPSIKFYLRTGLLPAGQTLSKTQADYAPAHVERLRLIRALREVGQLPIAAIQAILRAADDETVPVAELLATTHAAMAGPPPLEPGAGRAAAQALLVEVGWSLPAESPLIDSLGVVLQALHDQGRPIDAPHLAPWVRAAQDAAAAELAAVPRSGPRSATGGEIAVGAVLYGQLLTQLRLAARQALAANRSS
jgi:DNA-binding transcriptional MerR regulator